MRIHDMSPSLRPRERAIIENHVRSLSNTELLAILLRTGRKGKNALQLATEILSKTDGTFTPLWENPLSTLTKKGLGLVQAVTIQSALEMGHRMHGKNLLPLSKEDAIAWVAQKIGARTNESFYVICLDLRNKSICPPVLINEGNRYSVLVEPRDVLRVSLQHEAARIIVMHNHPSHDPAPSTQDMLLTKQLLEGCAWINIELVDHIIVTRTAQNSLREKGYFD